MFLEKKRDLIPRPSIKKHNESTLLNIRVYDPKEMKTASEPTLIETLDKEQEQDTSGLDECLIDVDNFSTKRYLFHLMTPSKVMRNT